MECLFPIICLGIYVYWGFALMTIANKKGLPNGWLAFIPIANIWLMLQIIKKPTWWIILFFIPFVNIIIGILIWMGIAEAMGFPNWWGVLVIVPIVNLYIVYMLAWGAPPKGATTPPPAK
jgi:magnesium-transporting ATPase (P-type)